MTYSNEPNGILTGKWLDQQLRWNSCCQDYDHNRWLFNFRSKILRHFCSSWLMSKGLMKNAIAAVVSSSTKWLTLIWIWLSPKLRHQLLSFWNLLAIGTSFSFSLFILSHNENTFFLHVWILCGCSIKIYRSALNKTDVSHSFQYFTTILRGWWSSTHFDSFYGFPWCLILDSLILHLN